MSPPGCQHRRPLGFTLTELLVVISILAMLATAGTLQLLRARIVAYEEIAISALRQVSRACHFFSLVNQRFPADLAELGNTAPPYIPATLVGNGTTVTKQGYVFTYAQAGSSFSLNADPQTVGVTGTRYFFVNEDLRIHVDNAGPADSGDPILP